MYAAVVHPPIWPPVGAHCPPAALAAHQICFAGHIPMHSFASTRTVEVFGSTVSPGEMIVPIALYPGGAIGLHSAIGLTNGIWLDPDPPDNSNSKPSGSRSASKRLVPDTCIRVLGLRASASNKASGAPLPYRQRP
jgi:hypothetical protein